MITPQNIKIEDANYHIILPIRLILLKRTDLKKYKQAIALQVSCQKIGYAYITIQQRHVSTVNILFMHVILYTVPLLDSRVKKTMVISSLLKGGERQKTKTISLVLGSCQ